MKKTILAILAFVVCIFFYNQFTYSQSFPIQVQLTQPPPNQLNLHHLWKADLTNNSGKEMKIYLEGFAEEESKGMIVEGQTKVFTMPTGKRTYMYEDFKTGSVKWFPQKTDYKTIIEQTGTAPDGTYRICITAKNESGDVVGFENCITVIIVNTTVPEITLISPEDGSKIEETIPIFIWSPPMPVIQGRVSYYLKIVELRTGQSLEDAVKKNLPITEEKNIITTQYKYSTTNVKLQPKIKYAWQVSTLSQNNELIKSDAWGFSISPTQDSAKPIEISTIVLNRYYSLSKEILNNFVLVSDSLNVQFINNYTFAESISAAIYDTDNHKLVSSKINNDGKLNKLNGLNRISIKLKKYSNLQPDKLYLLKISDTKSNYYINFKVTK